MKCCGFRTSNDLMNIAEDSIRMLISSDLRSFALIIN